MLLLSPLYFNILHISQCGLVMILALNVFWLWFVQDFNVAVQIVVGTFTVSYLEKYVVTLHKLVFTTCKLRSYQKYDVISPDHRL